MFIEIVENITGNLNNLEDHKSRTRDYLKYVHKCQVFWQALF